jgi:hypothetical protein
LAEGELDLPDLICVSESKKKKGFKRGSKKEGCIVKLTCSGEGSSQNEHNFDQKHFEYLFDPCKWLETYSLRSQTVRLSRSQTDTEPEGLAAMEQSPEDAGYSPMHAPTVEGGENLDSLFEYTLPGWAVTDNDEHPIEDEARAPAHGT